jgi:hypothetical protein
MIIAVRAAFVVFIAVVAIAFTAGPSIYHVAAIGGFAGRSATVRVNDSCRDIVLITRGSRVDQGGDKGKIVAKSGDAGKRCVVGRKNSVDETTAMVVLSPILGVDCRYLTIPASRVTALGTAGVDCNGHRAISAFAAIPMCRHDDILVGRCEKVKSNCDR